MLLSNYYSASQMKHKLSKSNPKSFSLSHLPNDSFTLKEGTSVLRPPWGSPEQAESLIHSCGTVCLDLLCSSCKDTAVYENDGACTWDSCSDLFSSKKLPRLESWKTGW